MLAEHSNDDNLYALFRSMRAPYDFLEHCQAVLQSRLRAHFDQFILVPRGSIITGTGLMAPADLDIDLILPRIIPELRQEEIEKKALARAQELGQSLSRARAEVFKELMDFLYDSIAPAVIYDDKPADFCRPPGAEVTRSLPLLLRVDGRWESVDLFPKIPRTRWPLVHVGQGECGARTRVDCEPIEHAHPRQAHRAAGCTGVCDPTHQALEGTWQSCCAHAGPQRGRIGSSRAEMENRTRTPAGVSAELRSISESAAATAR